MNAGKWLILGIFGSAIAAAGAAWWFRYSQTNQTHALWGTQAVTLILHAPNVRMIELDDNPPQPKRQNSQPRSINISTARGLINIRHLLTIDSSYRWHAGKAADVERLPWRYLLEFTDGKHTAQLMFSESCGLVGIKGSRAIAPLIVPAAREMKAFFDEQPQ